MSVYYIAPSKLIILLSKIWAIKRNHVTTIHQGTFVPKSTLGTRLPGTMLPQQYYCHGNIVASCFQQLAIFNRVVLCLKYMHQWVYNYCHASTLLCATLQLFLHIDGRMLIYIDSICIILYLIFLKKLPGTIAREKISTFL